MRQFRGDWNKKCNKCGQFEGLLPFHEHHLKPRFLGGNDNDGKIILCEECHIRLHKHLAEQMKTLTLWWL